MDDGSLSSSLLRNIDAAADHRAELNVQISMLAEAEITKLVELVSEMAERMNVAEAEEEEVEEMKRRVALKWFSTRSRKARRGS